MLAISDKWQLSIIEDWIGHAVGRHLGQAPEEQGECQHGEERLDISPGNPEDRLLIADLDVPPG